MMMCFMLVGCGSGVTKVKEVISEETTDIKGLGSFSLATISVEIKVDINEIDDLYTTIRPIDEEICNKIKIDRYDSVIVELEDVNGEYLGNMNIQNNKDNGITYDLSPVDVLGEWREDIRIN